MKEKNKLLQIAALLIIVCAVAAIIITAVNINRSLSSMTNLSTEESAATRRNP